MDVRIVVPGKHTDTRAVRYGGRGIYRKLLDAGVRIYEFQPTMLHSKVMLVDDIWCSIGSINFTGRSMKSNAEANVALYDPGFAALVRGSIESDMARCGGDHSRAMEKARTRPPHQGMLLRPLHRPLLGRIACSNHQPHQTFDMKPPILPRLDRRFWRRGYSGLTAALSLACCLSAFAAPKAPELPPLNTVRGSPLLPGKFVWADLVTDNALAAQQFYTKLFGWKFWSYGDYLIGSNDDRPLCGIFQRPRPNGPGRRAALVRLHLGQGRGQGPQRGAGGRRARAGGTRRRCPSAASRPSSPMPRARSLAWSNPAPETRRTSKPTTVTGSGFNCSAMMRARRREFYCAVGGYDSGWHHRHQPVE